MRAIAIFEACIGMFRKEASGEKVAVLCQACGEQVDEGHLVHHVMSRHPAVWTGILNIGG